MTEAIKPVVCLQEWLRRVHISHVMSPSTMSPKYTVLYIVNIVYSIQNIRNNTKILQEWLRRVHISHVMSPSTMSPKYTVLYIVNIVYSIQNIRNNTKILQEWLRRVHISHVMSPSLAALCHQTILGKIYQK